MLVLEDPVEVHEVEALLGVVVAVEGMVGDMVVEMGMVDTVMDTKEVMKITMKVMGMAMVPVEVMVIGVTVTTIMMITMVVVVAAVDMVVMVAMIATVRIQEVVLVGAVAHLPVEVVVVFKEEVVNEGEEEVPVVVRPVVVEVVLQGVDPEVEEVSPLVKGSMVLTLRQQLSTPRPNADTWVRTSQEEDGEASQSLNSHCTTKVVMVTKDQTRSGIATVAGKDGRPAGDILAYN